MKTYGRRQRSKNHVAAPVNHLKRHNKMIDELPDYGVEDSQAVEPWQEETQESQALPSDDHVIEACDHVTYDDASHVSDVSDSEAETQQVSFNQPPPSTQPPRNWLKRAAVESPLQSRDKPTNKKRVPENPVKSVRFEPSGGVPISSSPVVVLSSEMSRPSPSQVPITPITPADVANPPSTPDKYIVDVVPSTTPSYSPLTMEFVEEEGSGGVARRLFGSNDDKNESSGAFEEDTNVNAEFSNVADSQWQDEVLCSEDEEDVQVVPSSSQDQEVLTEVHGLTQDETVDETPDGQSQSGEGVSEEVSQNQDSYVPGETQYGPGDSLYEPETQYTDGEEETQYGDETVRPDVNPVTDSQYDPSDELLEDVHRDGQGYDFTQSITDERQSAQSAIEVSDGEEEEEHEQPPASMDEFHDAHESLSEGEQNNEVGGRQEIDLLSSIHDADYIHSSVHSPESMSEDNVAEAHSISDDAASPSASSASPNQPPPFTQPYKHHIIPDSDDEESQNKHFSQRFSQKVFKPFKQPTQTQPALKRVKAAESQEPQPITESQMLMSGLFVDTAPFDDEEDVVIPVRRQNETIDEDEYVSDSQDEGDVFPRPSLKREAFAHLPPLPPKPSITSSEIETQHYLGHSITDTLLEPLSDPESLTQDESER